MNNYNFNSNYTKKLYLARLNYFISRLNCYYTLTIHEKINLKAFISVPFTSVSHDYYYNLIKSL